MDGGKEMNMSEWLDDYCAYRALHINENGRLCGERLGQAFINDYFKCPYPELYYEDDDVVALETIEKWLNDNCYTDELPERIER